MPESGRLRGASLAGQWTWDAAVLRPYLPTVAQTGLMAL